MLDEPEDESHVHDSVDQATYYSGLRRSSQRTASEAPETYGFDAALDSSVMEVNGHVVIPATCKEAMRSEHNKEWRNAMRSKFFCSNNKKGWRLVKPPEN